MEFSFCIIIINNQVLISLIKVWLGRFEFQRNKISHNKNDK